MPDDDFLPADNDAWIDDQGRPHIVVRPLNSGLPVANGYDPVNDLASYVKSLPVDPLPTHEAYTQTAGEKVASILTGGNGQERYQFFPERMVRSALSLPADVMSGKLGPYADPYRNGPISSDVDPEDELLQRVQDMAGLMGTGPLAMKPGTATLGSGMIRSPNYVYHITPVENLNSILKEGLHPKIGERSALISEQLPAIHTFKSIDDAENALSNWLGDEFDENQKLVLLKVKVPENANTIPGADYEHVITQHIPPENINVLSKDFDGEGKYSHTLMSDTSKPGMALAALENAPTYYSAVENAVNTATTKSASPNQWLSTIQNSKGVKPEELEWNGLKSWLGSQEGNVSKEQVQSYLNENKTQVNEVNKGDDPSFWSTGLAPNSATKYSKWQLPGGENYREKLLTLPNGIQKYNDFLNSIRTKYGIKEGEGYVKYPLTDEEKSSISKLMIEADSPVFKSSHWDEPNILAHIRMNDRFIPDENGPKDVDSNFNERKGYKALHIEEIQSDWHQQGREQGYKLSKEAEAKLEPEFNRIDDKIINSNDEEIMGHPDINQSIKMAVDRKIITPDEAKSYLRYSNSQRLKAVPDAPFKKTWLDLAVKNVLREAAEKGMDRLSWTPGEAQAARYDLSKQVDSIGIKPEGENRHVAVYAKSGVHASGLVDKNGKIIQGYDAFRDAVGKPLSDVVGKEMAKKLMELEGEHSISGEGLKVGGEGMHYFYDKMLPNILEKLTGQKMKVGNVNAGPPKNTPHGYWAWEKAKRDEWNKENNRDLNISYIDLPQSVKNTALQKGFPLFSGGLMLNPVEQQPTVKLTPMNHDPFSKGNDSDPEVNNRDDVPYLAGASNTPSGYPVNIDRRMPRYDDKVKLPNGQPADLWKYLKLHEIAEYKQMQAGVPYEQAHIKGGTVAERQAVEADGVDWNEYEKVLDGYLSEIEHEHPSHPPKLLYDKPYPHNKRVILEKNEANEQ